MASTSKNNARIYLRRSTGKQEASLQMQLDWALQAASTKGIVLNGGAEDLEHMLANSLHQYKDLIVDDGLSGADLERPGLRCLLQVVENDKSIDFLFVHKRDRMGRPSNPLEMAQIEQTISQAGVTIVMSTGELPAIRRGRMDVVQTISSILEYNESGNYLVSLADRVLQVQSSLARQGFWTGGRPPFGFARVLVDPDGNILETLEDGRHVRQRGCHTRIIPVDFDKIAIWIHILELKDAGYGYKYIAKHLNERKVPSPGAGTVRTDRGVRHQVSGKWCANTVAELCRNRAILGLIDYGRRSEGKHKRLGNNGSRDLEDSDYREDGKTRLVFNEPDRIVTGQFGESHFDVSRWEGIQASSKERGRNQRGIAKTKDRCKYPLAGRIFDLTDNCGSCMHSVTHSKRVVYKCGRYVNTAGAECDHNVVDGEAMLRLTLKMLVESVDRLGDRDRLRELLLQRARRENEEPKMGSRDSLLHRAQDNLSRLRQESDRARARMAREQDERIARGYAEEFKVIQEQICAAESEVRLHAAKTSVRGDQLTPQQEADKAMALFDDIIRVANDPQARTDVNSLLNRLGVRIGLTFGEGIKRTRKVRRLLHGVIAFGNSPLPVRIHGRDNREDGLPALGGMPHATDQLEITECVRVNPAALSSGSGEPERTAGLTSGCAEEGLSFSKDSRGDRIRTCDFMLPKQQATDRNFLPHQKVAGADAARCTTGCTNEQEIAAGLDLPGIIAAIARLPAAQRRELARLLLADDEGKSRPADF